MKDFWPLGMHIPFNPQYINRNAMTIEQYEKAKIIIEDINRTQYIITKINENSDPKILPEVYISIPTTDRIKEKSQLIVNEHEEEIKKELMNLLNESLDDLTSELNGL